MARGRYNVPTGRQCVNPFAGRVRPPRSRLVVSRLCPAATRPPCCCCSSSQRSLSARGTKADYERSTNLRNTYSGKVFKAAVDPHWSADGNAFWYRNDLPGGQKEYVVVDAVKGTRGVVPESKRPKWDAKPAADAQVRPGRDRGPRSASPDGKWSAFVRDHNVWLRDKKAGGERQLSRGGTAADGYDGQVFWSPDSTKLVAVRVKAGGDRRVTLIESSPKDRLQPKTDTYFYLKPGDDIPAAEAAPVRRGRRDGSPRPGRPVPQPVGLLLLPLGTRLEALLLLLQPTRPPGRPRHRHRRGDRHTDGGRE